MVEFVDPMIYKYIADEFYEAVSELDQVRRHLQLEDECCEQVLQESTFLRTIQNWQRSSNLDDQFSFLDKPQSVNDTMLPGYS